MPYELFLDVTLVALGAFTIGSNTLRVLRCRSVEGVALTTVMLSLLASLSWVAYGIDGDNVAQTVANVLNAVGFALVLAVGHHTRVFHASLAGASVGAFAVVAAGIIQMFGMNGLGLTVSLLTFVNRMPQIRKAWLEPGGRGLSIGGQAGDATQSALWTLNGIMLLDPWLISTSLYCMTSSAFVAFRTFIGRRVAKTPIIDECDNEFRPDHGVAVRAVA